MKYFNQVCDTSSFVTHAPVMIGKKFQVSMPSTTQLDVSTQIHMKEKVLSDLNVSYGKSSIGDKMIDEESSFILTDFTIQNICSELLSHLTKATDCDDLVLSSETSTQIGLIKPTAIVSRVDYNQKDSSTQTDLPYIYITETKNTSSWKTDLNKNNEKYTKGIYKQPNDYMVDERIPKSGTADISTTRKDSLKFVANSEPIVDSSSRLLLNTSSHNEILNHYISTTDMHQTDLIPNTQIKRTFASTQYGEVEFHSWTNESLPPQQIKGIVNKQKKVRRNLTEIPVNRKLTNRRAVSTYGDVIMNIELHGTRCKRSIRECDYLYTIEKMHDHKCLIPTSSSSSCEGIDDLCDSCRLKYYKPVQMNIEMKAFHRCHRKLKRLGSHYKSRYPDNRDIHLRTFTRCLSADNLDMSKQKGDIIKPVTAKRS
ncbi:unnamed protein product [Heterobilharzia americana]|nr:unnamed protein product [Heterobilharzia americana]